MSSFAESKEMTPAELAKSNSEHAHQRALFARINENLNWQRQRIKENPTYVATINFELLNLLFAIPNGGERHKAVAGKMKAEGAKSGVYDLFLPVPAPKPNSEYYTIGFGIWHGLFIEMKEPGRRNHKNGGLSDNQVTFRDAMLAQGYACEVCYTYEEAFAALLRYLGG